MKQKEKSRVHRNVMTNLKIHTVCIVISTLNSFQPAVLFVGHRQTEWRQM